MAMDYSIQLPSTVNNEIQHKEKRSLSVVGSDLFIISGTNSYIEEVRPHALKLKTNRPSNLTFISLSLIAMG
jgi:hypothetical protein